MRYQSPFTIRRPKYQSRKQRTAMGILRTVFWALWFYLWIPLLTVILWLLGAHETYAKVFKGARGANLEIFPWLVIGSVCLVMVWSGYNRARYGGKTRRLRAEPLAPTAKIDAFGVSNPVFIEQLHQRKMEIQFDEHGQITHVA